MSNWYNTKVRGKPEILEQRAERARIYRQERKLREAAQKALREIPAESHKQRKAIEDQIKSLEKQKPHGTIILTK